MKPFFLTYGTFNPHMSWFVPQKYFDMFPLDAVKTPALNPDDFDDIPPLGDQAYLATTAYVDVQPGRVLDALAKSPYRGVSSGKQRF